MKRIDMMGKPCPMPVIEARRALLAGNSAVIVEVDNEIAVQNLEKMAHAEGYGFAQQCAGEQHFSVTLSGGRDAGAKVAPSETVCAQCGGMTVAVGRECMGAGADELGKLLMKGFLFSLGELKEPPAVMLFFNGGAKLTTEGANTVEDLRALEMKGTKIYTCGTCANFFGIRDNLAVGEITDMMQIVRWMSESVQLVSL